MDGTLTPLESQWLERNLPSPTGSWDGGAFRHFAGDALLDAEAQLLAVVPIAHDQNDCRRLSEALRGITEDVIEELPAGWADAMRAGDTPTVAVVQAVVCIRLASKQATPPPGAVGR